MSLAMIGGLEEIGDACDTYFVDVWGSIHDGVEVYPGAIDCLRRLRAAGRNVVFIANIPRPGSSLREQFQSWGIPRDYYDDVVSSGDITIAALNNRNDPWHASLGSRFYHLGSEQNLSLVQEIDGEPVPFDAAQFILTTCLVDPQTETPIDYRELLSETLLRGLPMVCANPDRVSVYGKRTLFRAGALANEYRQSGGNVRAHGKPYPEIYRVAMARNGITDASRAIMVGDGLATDIAGAHSVGMDSLWIVSGVHGNEAGYIEGEPLNTESVGRVLENVEPKPTAVSARFIW